MYFQVGPYTPYFGFGYRGIKNVPTMRPPMFDPLINPMASPKPILKIAQIEIVTNYEEPSNEDQGLLWKKTQLQDATNCSYRKIVPWMEGKTISIIDVSRPPISGQVVPINNGGYRNLKIGFVTKCGIQGLMKPRECVHYHKWGKMQEMEPMTPKCTPTLGVALMWES